MKNVSKMHKPKSRLLLKKKQMLWHKGLRYRLRTIYSMGRCSKWLRESGSRKTYTIWQGKTCKKSRKFWVTNCKQSATSSQLSSKERRL